MERFVIICLSIIIEGPDYHCIDGSPAMGACSSKNGNHDCLGTSQHLKCCVNSVVKEPYKDGVCCLESVSCGVGRTAGLSQTASGSGLIQRVIGGASSLPVVGDLRGGVPDLRFGASDLRGGVADVRVGDTAMIGSALTAGVPPSGRVFTRETVSVKEPLGGGARSVFRQSGGVAGTVIDSMGRAVGGAPGMMIGTSVFGDSTRAVIGGGPVGADYTGGQGGVVGAGSGIVDRAMTVSEHTITGGVNIVGDSGVMGTGAAVIGRGPVGMDYRGGQGGVVESGSGIVDNAPTVSEHTITGGPVGDIPCPGGFPNAGLCASYMECDDRARAKGQPDVRYDCIGRDAVRRLSRRQTGICCRRRGHVIGAGTGMVGVGAGIGIGLETGMTDIAAAAGSGPVDIGIADIGFVQSEGTGQPGSDRGARLCHSRGAEPKFHANGQVDECTRRYNHCPGDNVRCEFFNDETNKGVCCEMKVTVGVGHRLIGGPVIDGPGGYPDGRMDSTVVDVARVDIVGDKGVIGEGTAIIKTSPDTSLGPNPVVGPSVGRGMVDVGSMGLVGSSMGGRMFDAASGGIIGSGSRIVDAATTITEQAFTGGPVGDIPCPGGFPNAGLCASYMECDDRARAQGQLDVRYDCIGRDAVRRLSRRQTGICCRRRGHVIGAGTGMVGVGAGIGIGLATGMTDIAAAAGSGPVDIGIADIGVVPSEGTGQPGSDRGARLCHSRGAEPKFHANGQVDECTRRYSHCPGDNVRCEFFNDRTNKGVCCEMKVTVGVGPGVIGGPVIDGPGGYPGGRADSTVVDVARVDIVGDKGVIGEGTAIIKTSPDNPLGPNPVVVGPSVGVGMVNAGSAGLVGSSIGDRMFDAARGGIIGSGSGFVDAATTITEQIYTGGIGGDIRCRDGSSHDGFCFTYLQCDNQNRAKVQLGIRYRCTPDPAAMRVSRRTGICCRQLGHGIGSGTMGVGIGTRIGSGVGHGTSMTDYGTRDDTRTIGVGTRIGSGTMGVGVGTSIESGVGLGAGITDYGAGSGVMRRGSKAMVTDIDTTAADGTITLPLNEHRPRFHGETICYRLNERPHRRRQRDGRLVMSRCTMRNDFCPSPSLCRRARLSHWGTCCVRGPRPTQDMLAAIQ